MTNPIQQLNIQQYKAFLFDLDGTLIDGSDRHFMRCVSETAKEFGRHDIEIPPGAPLGDFVRQHFPAADDEFVDRFRERNKHRMMNTPRPVEFHHDTIDFIRAFPQVKRAIVTNCKEWELELTERYVDIRQCCDILVHKTDTIKGKPAGDMYLLAAQKLSVPPEKCLIFEDSQTGICAGKDANMTVVAIDRGVHKEFYGADYVISSFLELL